MSSKGIALVTGAAQGIGRGIALRLAKDGFGVVVNDIRANKQNLDNVSEEIRSHGRRTAQIIADVSVESEVKRMVDTVVTELGGLDVVSDARLRSNMAHN